MSGFSTFIWCILPENLAMPSARVRVRILLFILNEYDNFLRGNCHVMPYSNKPGSNFIQTKVLPLLYYLYSWL